MASFTRKLWKWTAGTFAVLVILLGLAVGVFRIVLGQVPDYEAQIQAWISERSGVPVAFSGLDARWRFYGPELVFEGATVSTPDGGQALVRARRGSVAFDIWASLVSGRLTAGRFWLDGPELVLVRTPEGRIQLVGQDELPERTTPFLFDDLPIGRFSVSNATVIFTDLATGRGPWQFARAGLTLRRDATTLRLQGTAELPAALGRQVEFAARSAGRLDEPESLDWNFSIEAQDLALSGLRSVLPETWPAPAAGTGTFRLAGVLEGARVNALSGSIDLAAVDVPLPVWTMPLPAADPLVIRTTADPLASGVSPSIVVGTEAPQVPTRVAFDIARGRFDMQRDDDSGWRLVVQGLQLVRPGARWDPSRLELSVRGSDDGGLALSGAAEFLSLDNVWPLLAYLPQREDTARLLALRASGRLSDLTFRLNRPRTEAPLAYSLAANLDGVGFAPVGRVAGLRGLTGVLAAGEQGGRFDLAAQQIGMELPRLFREPLVTDQVAGTFTWVRTGEGWRISSDSVAFSDADGRAHAQFTLNLPVDVPDALTWLELDATAEDLDATATSRYLPAGRLTQRTLDWLDRAFNAGRVRTASVEYRGPIRGFPFRNGEGTFVARADFTGMSLDYHPRWLPLSQLDGRVEFRNAGLAAQVSRGRVHDLTLSSGRVTIADFKEAELDIEASATGDLGAALAYLQRSSVGPLLGERFLGLTGRGATAFGARLWLPVRNLRARRVEVTADLADAEVGFSDVPQRLTALTGMLKVEDRALVAEDLSGRFLGGPVNLTLVAQENPAGPVATVLSAAGRAQSGPLTDLLDLPEPVRLSGSTAWRMQARFVPGNEARDAQDAQDAQDAVAPALQQSFVIESDLAGLGIGLPAPVRKLTNERWPFRAEIEVGREILFARGSLGDLRGVARFARDEEGWSFDRAGLRADGMAASVPGHAGVRIEGDVGEFVLDDWLALRRGSPAAPGALRLQDVLKAANVRIGRFGLSGYAWRDVRGLLQATDVGWQIDVAGPDAEGELVVPYDPATTPLTLEMERLAIVAATPRGGQRPLLDPRRVPAVRARVNELVMGGRELGNVHLELDRTTRGLDITQLTAQSSSFTADLKGSWYAYDNGAAAPSMTTTIDARLVSTEVRPTLQALGYSDILTGERGLLQAKLSWPGGPDLQGAAHASGTVHIELDDGQVLDLQPGAGRMLGLLSIAALPRRLSLDFSDLTDEGLAFDSIRGDFDLKDGNAYTSNLLLTGPAAEIGVAGRTGLATRDYDQTAVVTGNIGATLPVAGAIAGGPVGAAAMLLFSQVFKEPLKGITRGYYRISGSWDEPEVERVIASTSQGTAAQVPDADAGAQVPSTANP